MHARVTTIEIDPARADEAVRQLEEREIPSWKELDGFRGFTLLIDRSTVKGIGTSYWESREQMDASEEAVKDSRQRAIDT